MATTTADEVLQHIASQLRQPVEKLDAGVELTDVAADSFVLVEMAVTLQEDFDVYFRQSDLEAVRTVGDLVALVLSRQG